MSDEEIVDLSDSPIEEDSELPVEVFVPTDEAEEITAEEAATTDIPLPAPEEDAGHLTCTVCDCCLELNLTTKTVITCQRCEQAFCYHFASSVDPMYCVNCLSDISMQKSLITKTYEHTNPETSEHTFYRRRAREIKIDGLDWLFAQRKITELSDVELDLMIEYHRNILSLMITEGEQRRAAKMHRYANVKLHIATPSSTTVTDSTHTTVKKVRTVSKNKAAEQMAALLKSMLNKGITAEMIARMVKK
jgi:YesN/AraC family two-component response regulator